MRVGLVIYGSLETVSGGFLYDRLLVEHLRAAGDQVEIFSLPFRSYALLLSDNWSRELERTLLTSRLDVLIQDELNHPSLFALNPCIRDRLGCPIVSIVHHLRSQELRPGWQNWIYRWIERQYLNSVDAFVFNSQSSRRTVETLLTETKPSTVAYPGGDRLGSAPSSDFVRMRARQSAPAQLLFLGNVIPRKGLHTVLSALGQVPEDQWTLTVVGSLTNDPAYVSHVRALAQRLGIASRIRFTGSLDNLEVTAILARSNLLVVPSSFEGYGIVYAEAMRWGVPVIASTAGGACEIVEHGITGALIPPGDVDALAWWVNSLTSDRARLESLSLAANERTKTQPTWSESTAAIRGFLQSIAG